MQVMNDIMDKSDFISDGFWLVHLDKLWRLLAIFSSLHKNVTLYNGRKL